MPAYPSVPLLGTRADCHAHHQHRQRPAAAPFVDQHREALGTADLGLFRLTDLPRKAGQVHFVRNPLLQVKLCLVWRCPSCYRFRSVSGRNTTYGVISRPWMSW